MLQSTGSGPTLAVFFPVDFTNDAYKLGVNYIVYGMTTD